MDKWELVHHGHTGTEVLAIHAVLLPDGRVAYFSGSEHNVDQHKAGQFDHSRVWDPTTGETAHIASPHHDLFCCGHAFLADGRLLVAGGTETYQPAYRGSRRTVVFDPAAIAGHHHENPWKDAPDMGGGRWYPTLVTLPDGRVMTSSGTGDDPVLLGTNPAIEVFSADGPGAWTYAGDQPEMPPGYPRMHLLPNGRVLCVTPMSGQCRTWNPASLGWGDIAFGPGPEYVGYNTTSVLLPLLPADGYRARVLVAGAAQPRVLDLGNPGAGWQPTHHRPLPGSPVRNHACAVLLPDGTVVVTGGSTTEQDADAVLEPEIFDPASGQWSVGAPAKVPRVYHNVALLLADGRVFTAGSNHNGAQGHSEHRIELYHPDYLDGTDRPVITRAPSVLDAPTGIPSGATFDIETPQAASVSSIALLRCGSVTHAFDADQRYVGLEIVGRGANRLTVRQPPLAEIAPPGPYFLYLLDQRVPSPGWPVQVRPVLWSPVRAVPGSLGWETQGADVALADISGSGRLDMVVLYVDNPEGENHGYYRIGWDVDSAGNPSSWTGPRAIPGWFGSETSDAGVAVADISGSGRPDLVVFHVDNPPGDNHGHYRIGWDLDVTGNPSGWTDVKAIPGSFGWETAGAGLAIADVSGTGRPDLVVLYVDNPPGDNAGYYRIGWDIDTAGNAGGGWSQPTQVPGWFGWETGSAGVAVADISGSGRPDLVVFHVDNPAGENQGYCRIGRDLNSGGTAVAGWTEPVPILGWFGAETAGAGVAAGDMTGNGRPDVVIFHVDNPPGDNLGFFRVLLR
jgi:hypothetical protein